MTAQAPLRCAGCGTAGHAPVIVYDRAQAPPGAVLTPVFAWGDPPRTVLLCAGCKAKLRRRRRRARP